MTTAPYSPETLGRIRQMAPNYSSSEIAKNLGWDHEFVLSVSRRHSIELKIANGKPSCLDQGVVSAGVTDHRSGDESPKDFPDGISWNSRTHEVSRHGLVLALPGRQAELFAKLYRAYRACVDEHVKSSIFDRSQSQTCDIARKLRRRLLPLRIFLEGNKGPGGGYRLNVEE